jgi:predicted RNase H-like nuclease (RuvC/YqgF family)
MAKATYYWNDETMSLSYAGQDFVAGDEIPESYSEEQPEKFKFFCDNLQISKQRKVQFEKKKQIELGNLKDSVERLEAEKKELKKEIKAWKKKEKSFEANIAQIEELEFKVAELEDLKTNKKELEKLLKALK